MDTFINIVSVLGIVAIASILGTLVLYFLLQLTDSKIDMNQNICYKTGNVCNKCEDSFKKYCEMCEHETEHRIIHACSLCDGDI